LQLSRIFKWFRSDFEDGGGLLSCIAKYAEPDVALEITQGCVEVECLDCDWSLNGT
jgi:hypothetical protein